MAPPGAFVSHRLELPRPSCSGPRSPMPPTGEGTDLAYGAARRGRSGREGAEGRRRPGWQPESPTMVKSGAVISNTRRGCTPVEPGHEEGGQMAEMMAESAQPTVPPSDDRILPSGDEAGTAPGDRALPARCRGSAGGGRPPGGPLPLGGIGGVGRLRRGGRLLRDLGLRHHRCPAAGTGLDRGGPPSSPSTGGAVVGSSRRRPW